MKLKLTVAALAAAFAAPMANADVTISGTFAPFVGYQSTSAYGGGNGALGGPIAATAKQSGIFLNDASSRFAITSTEDLGDGMNAGAFVEIRGQNGTFPDYGNNAVDAGLFGPFRYGVSVGGGWGKLEIGRNFSPYTWTLIIEHPDGQGPVWHGAFAILGQAGGQGLFLNGGGAGVAAGMHAFFRTGTGLHFTSANYGGLSFRAAYMTESNKNNSAIPGASIPETNELSISADYKPEDAPYYLGAVYSTRADANGANGMTGPLGGAAQTLAAGTTMSSTDTVLLIGGGLKFGDLKVGIWMDRVKYKTSNVTAGLSDISRTAFWIPVTYNLPTGVIGASYLKANDLSGTNVGGTFATGDTGASAIQASYYHSLSKQTQPYVMFQRVANGANGVYAGAPGVTATQIIAGIQHSF